MCRSVLWKSFGTIVISHKMCQVYKFALNLLMRQNIFAGMTADVRWILDKEGCIPEKLCKIFGYQFVRNLKKCCSNCDEKE